MVSCLRLKHFVDSANASFFLSPHKALVAEATGMGVLLKEMPHSLSEDLIDQNRNTWKVFRENLVGTIGQNKFDWICHRYRSKLNFTRMEQTGQPLLPKHVELFSIGSSQLMSRDVKARFSGRLRALTREQLTERIRSVQPFSIVGKYYDPVNISGSPSSLSTYFIHDKLLMDKEKQLLFSDTGRLSFSAWMERFAKVTINRELVEGQIIPAPGQDGHIDYYKVYQKVTTGDGLVAYALKPATKDSTLKPWIVFRPSQWAFSNEDAFETYLNDVQKNVGEMGWNPAHPLFEKLVDDPHFRRGEEKVNIAGYSLGGAHAQRFLEHYYEKVSNAIFYNDPSVDNETAERIRDKVNAMPTRTEPLNLQIFRMKGDFCNYVGGKHAGWGINRPDVNIQLLEMDHENKQVSGFYLHAHRIFDNTTFPYQMNCVEDTQELFNHLDNTKRGPDVLWYERTRLLWGNIAFYSFYSLSQLIKLTSAVFGVRILRSSRTPDL